MRVVPAAVAAVLLAGCAAGAPNAATSSHSTTDNAGPAASAAATATLGRFSKDAAMRHVFRLADDIGPRVRGTIGERRGARYIARRFRALGYNVNVQKFEVDGNLTSRNVVAWWPGARRYPVVLGAHMDTVPDAPGANDNASGVAVILELARIAAATEQVAFVRFVAFGSEEFGPDGEHHVGSQVFVNRLGNHGRRRLAGMLSIDMIADGRPLLTGTSGIADEVVARAFYRKATKLGIDVSYETLCDCSDNGPFEHAGIPAGFVWSGREPDYHSPSDTTGNMVPDDLLRTGRAVRAFLRALDKEMLDRFRDA